MPSQILLISFVIATISLICTTTTLVLIKLMKTWNGHMLLIATMTGMQLLYDINYMLGIVPGFDACMTWHFLDILGGLGCTFTTNVISFVILYIVNKIYVFNIIDNFYIIAFIVIIIPLIIACMSLSALEVANDDALYCSYKVDLTATFVSNFYYWGRFVSIIFNIIAFGYISYRVNQITNMGTKSTDTRTQSTVIVERQILAIDNLAKRMKYYPIIQAISRCASAWNEYDNRKYSNYASNLTSHILAPLSGTFYFLIFLMMQPKARRIFISWFGVKQNNLEDSYNVDPSGENAVDAINRVFRISEFDESELEGMIADEGSMVHITPATFTLGSNPSSGSRYSVNNPIQNPSDGSRYSVDSEIL